MMKSTLLLTVPLTLALFAGCSQKPAPTAPAAPASSAAPAMNEAEATNVAKAMAELPPDDRAAAEKQKVCPVSGEPLGSMGKPYKVTINGRDVFLCCDGCEEELRAHPEKYLK